MINAKNSPIAGAHGARKIGVRTQRVRGRISRGQEYESMLERNFLTLLRFDHSVESFISQPLTIPYMLGATKRNYTPDVLVKYKADSQGQVRKTTLFEVKPSEFADQPDDELAAKLAAANLHCQAVGWDFELACEDQIDTTRLKNANFLLRYLMRDGDPGQQKLLLEQLKVWNGCAAAKALLAGVYRSRESQAELIPDLWTLVAKGVVWVDLDSTLSMNSEVWVLK